MNAQQQYKNDKQIFFRCVFHGDVDGLSNIVRTSTHCTEWVLDGMFKASEQQQWECLKMLACANVSSHSPWNIHNCVEMVLFHSVERGHSQCAEAMLDFIDTHGLQNVAQEALRRAVDNKAPNAVDTAKFLWRYADEDHKKRLLESSVAQRNVALVEFFSSQLPLRLTTEPEGLVGEADLFGLLLLAARPYTSVWNAKTLAHEVAQIQATQTDVLNILLRNVDPEILMQCLSLASKDDQYNGLLNDWIDQQRLQKALTQAVGGLEAGSPLRKRKV